MDSEELKNIDRHIQQLILFVQVIDQGSYPGSCAHSIIKLKAYFADVLGQLKASRIKLIDTIKLGE